MKKSQDLFYKAVKNQLMSQYQLNKHMYTKHALEDINSYV